MSAYTICTYNYSEGSLDGRVSWTILPDEQIILNNYVVICLLYEHKDGEYCTLTIFETHIKFVISKQLRLTKQMPSRIS